MKDGWEIKKLGEFIAEYSVRNKGGADLPVYSVTNSQGFCKDYFSKDVASKERSTYKIVPKGCFAYNPSRINVGSVDWQRYEDKVIVSPLYVVFEVSEKLRQDFLLYYLKSDSTILKIKNLATGTVRANLKFDILSNFSISVPPLPEQERIVSELDCINGILEKKREQIKELDALAQSIFYQMFGDPVTNEKGWEVRKLGEVCKTTSGGTPSKGHNEYYDGGTIPWLRSGEVNKMFIYDSELYITEEGLNNSAAKWFPENTVVIAMYGATVGQVGILKNKMTTNQAICGIFPNDSFLPIYLYHFLLGKKQAYIEMAAGGAQPNISQNIVRDTLVGCPPLPLQQSFASKIEAIEKQKELIKRSIAEVETLLASRMQHHFN